MRETRGSLSDLCTRWTFYPGMALFLASFLSLFLELLLIRWVPSVMRIVAYYANLMLISSFLGLSCGVLLARKKLDLFRWFAPLLLLLVVLVSAFTGVDLQSPDEFRFVFTSTPGTATVVTILIFVANALVFVPLGELIGDYLQRLPPLQAYSWDLGGAIAGTVLFGFFSYFWFSPILGSVVVMGIYLIFCVRRGNLMMTCTPFFIPTLTIMASNENIPGIWSPYNRISVIEAGADGDLRLVSNPAAGLGTMRDPPFYVIQVNRTTYMWAGTIDGRRYTAPSRYELNFGEIEKRSLSSFAELYALPHLIRPEARDVLVVGSGGGLDVEAALLYGAKQVHAVEIDPAIIRMGHQYSASQSYKNPRVSVYNTDARAFFKQSHQKYDMVVFGYLDSQSLFSQMSNIRLDGYVHTRESFREAFSLLRAGGLLSVSFYVPGKVWLLDRLVSMVRSATTDSPPLVYVSPGGQAIILAGKGFVPEGPVRFLDTRKVTWVPLGTPEATDDWPYLYLRKRFIPSDYLITMGILLLISVGLIVATSDRRMQGIDLHFFFLGAGFLLLEAKSITTISLYFGTTWFVSMVVILGVLIMVLLANLVASTLPRPTLTLYLPLIASVGFLYLFPVQSVSAWSFLSRLIFSLTIIPLPIFFAGLIFSTTFRESREPSLSFGSNLLGAVVGGFVEYLGMITGMKALLLVVVVFYLASLLVRLRTAQVLPVGA